MVSALHRIQFFFPWACAFLSLPIVPLHSNLPLPITVYSTTYTGTPRLFSTAPTNDRGMKRQDSLIWYFRLPPQHITYSIPMPITTYGIYRPSLNTLGQTPIAFLVTRRRVLVAVFGTPEEAHAVTEGTAPLVLQAAPVVPVQTGLRVDNMSDADISLQWMVSVQDKQRVTNWEGDRKISVGARTCSSDVLLLQPVHQASEGPVLAGDRSTVHHPFLDFGAEPSACSCGALETQFVAPDMMTGSASASATVFWIRNSSRRGMRRREDWIFGYRDMMYVPSVCNFGERLRAQGVLELRWVMF